MIWLCIESNKSIFIHLSKTWAATCTERQAGCKLRWRSFSVGNNTNASYAGRQRIWCESKQVRR